jgi:hypothetical protein
MNAAWRAPDPAEMTAVEPCCAAQRRVAEVHTISGLDGAVEAADAEITGSADAMSAEIVDLDSVGSPGPESRCRAGGLGRQSSDAVRGLDGDRRPGINLAEVARKRAALAAQVACHHFRLLSALKAAGEHARRTGDVQTFDDLDDQRTTMAAFSASVSAAADNAHAEWMSLRAHPSCPLPNSVISR